MADRTELSWGSLHRVVYIQEQWGRWRCFASLLSDAILGKKNEFATPFDPKRKLSIPSLRVKGWDYIEEFIGGALKNLFKF